MALPKKADPIWNEPVSTGNAGALARYERDARNSFSAKKFEIERTVHAVRARAPALPALAFLFLSHHFLGKAGLYSPLHGRQACRLFEQSRNLRLSRAQVTNLRHRQSQFKPRAPAVL